MVLALLPDAAGASLFLAEIVLIGWVQFGHSVLTACTMTVLCVIGALYYQLRVASRWRYLVNFPDPTVNGAAPEIPDSSSYVPLDSGL